MPKSVVSCELCLKNAVNLAEGRGEEIFDPDQVDSLKFLAGRLNPGARKYAVCQTCSAKIKLIASIRADSVKVKTARNEETDEEPEALVDEEKDKREQNDADDVELEELDQLSLFYAEHDDPEKDPDFAPKSTRKISKKPSKKTKTRRQLFQTPNKISDNKSNEVSTAPLISFAPAPYVCPECPSKGFANIEAIKTHFVQHHEYQAGKDKTKDQNISVVCKICSLQFRSQNEVFGHVLAGHCSTSKPFTSKLFSCPNCGRTFHRKTTLKSHSLHCYASTNDLGSNRGCKICGKDILPSRMAAHRSFEHVCRICDDQTIFANRKEKCQHLEVVHKWWTKNKVKKALGEVECPREGCLQKFARGSKRLKSHVKRDHDQSGDDQKRKYECEDCHALLKNITCLRSHKETKHGPSEGRMKCPFCDFSVGKWRKHSLYRYVLE